MIHFGVMTAFVLYLIATIFYFARVIFNSSRFSALALRVTMVAALMQTITLVYWLFHSEMSRLDYDDAFQLSSWILALAFIGLCFFKKFYVSGPFFIVVIDVFNLLSFTLKNPHLNDLSSHGLAYLYVHLFAIFMSLAIFTVGLIVAIMFVMSVRQLKAKRFEGLVQKFPSLVVLEEVHYKSLYVGFMLFTLAIVTGAGYSKVMTGHYIGADVKQVLSIVAWIFFALFLNLRVRQGWQGHKGVLLSFIGFAAMILLFLIGL